MTLLGRAGDWLDERTGWRASSKAWLDHPLVGGASWAAAMAASVAACFAVLAVTGVALMTSYAPAPQAAWASVHYVQFVQPGGALLRGIHYWAAQALILLAAVQIAHGALAALHRKPRELAWWLTVVVLALTLAEAITGGLLPWDQRGWWARVVEGNIIGLAPGLGSWLEALVLGGAELGAEGLARGFTAHVVLLPILFGLTLWARAKLVSRHGWSADAKGGVSRGDWLNRAVLVGGATVLAICIIASARSAPLDAPADPMSDYPARPEWYLLPLFEMRKLFHGIGELPGTTLPVLVAAAYLVLLPWIDRPGRSRAVAAVPLAVIVGGALALGGAVLRKDARDATYQKQRAKADAVAASAIRLAMNGVPPEGALAMVQRDPDLRGAALFDRYCAGCHVLGDMGDAKKATAAKLTGWGTPEWILAMMHDPDAPEFFGRGPYAQQMPSVDQRPKDRPANQPWTPILKTDAEKQAVAAFLSAEGDEPGDPPRPIDPALRATGEKIVSGRCTACHLWKGEGDDEGSGLAPELARYGSLAWTEAQVKNPSSLQTYREKALGEELKKHMPRFDKELSAEDAALVARWTRARGRGIPVP
jgi:ubiquinol-cytochrome c reductase cytochrome b subunit